MTLYLACFDIADDKARNRVGKLLGHYGERVQKSVFEVVLRDSAQLERLKRKLAVLLEPEDDLRFYRLCRSCRKSSHDARGKRIGRIAAAKVV